jgi:hypothetical protein
MRSAERSIHEIGGPQVGREDDELIEGHFEALAGMKLEEIDAALQRHDPPIENILGADELPAEVIDNESRASPA